MPQGGTIHVVARCNNREFSFTTPTDFEVCRKPDEQYTCSRGEDQKDLNREYLFLYLDAPAESYCGRPLPL